MPLIACFGRWSSFTENPHSLVVVVAAWRTGGSELRIPPELLSGQNCRKWKKMRVNGWIGRVTAGYKSRLQHMWSSCGELPFKMRRFSVSNYALEVWILCWNLQWIVCLKSVLVKFPIFTTRRSIAAYEPSDLPDQTGWHWFKLISPFTFDSMAA